MAELHKGDLVEFITEDAFGIVVEIGIDSIMKVDYVKVYWLKGPDGLIGTTLWRPMIHFHKLSIDAG